MKKFFAMMMAIVMCVACMTACSAPAGSANTGDGSTITIGGVGPLTGDYANYGISVRNGMAQAVEEINANGGINGMTVVLDFQDSAADPDSAVAAYGKLMDNGINVFTGGVLSGETASTVAAAREDGIAIVTPTATADAAIEGNSNAFRVCFTDSSQGLASADYIADNNMADKVAVFYQSDIDYSAGLFENFKTQCDVRGVEIVEVQTFTSDSATDFSTQINAIADCGVSLVYIPIYAAEASTFLTQAQGKLDGKIFFGCDGLDGILGKVSDPAIAENVLMLTPFAADSTEADVQAFVSDYKAAYGATPDQFAASGYDTIYAIKAAVETADVTSADADFSSKVVAAMTTIEVDGVTGTMTWGENGETTKAAQAMIIHDGVASLYAAG